MDNNNFSRIADEGPTAAAVTESVEATAEIAAAIRRIMVERRTPLLPEEGWPKAGLVGVDGIMHNIYATNTGKLAAWVSASHVEKAPKKNDPTPPTP